MAKHIILTETGGAWPGMDKESPRIINPDKIKSIQKTHKGEQAATIITFDDNKRIWVKETEQEIAMLLKQKEQGWLQRMFGFMS